MRLHPKFKLNGVSYTKDALFDVGYSLVKEGEPYEVPIGDFLLDWLNDVSTISVTTSGSTGRPKVIALQKEHMANSALATAKYFQLEAGDSALLCLPAHFIAGKMMLVRAMVLGLELDYVIPDSQPLKAKQKTYDFVAMVPLQAANSISQLGNIEKLIIGGAKISSELKEQLLSIGIRVFETYGMTETCTHIALKPIGMDSFKALPGVLLSQDNRGCLVVNAPAIGVENLVTNDVITFTSEDAFKWMGRFDNIINSGGVKIIPEQVETKLNKLFKNRFFVVGLPDKQLGQKVALVYEGTQNSGKLEKLVKNSGELSKYEVPKLFFGVPSFIETKTGKINRKLTVKLLESNPN